MKKSSIIYTLTLSISLLLSYSSQAQQQKKPSERSFAAEITKIKTIQATRNQKISQMQQPTDNATIPVSTTAAGQNQTNNTSTSPEKKPAGPAVKPSSGSMRPAKKPTASRG